MTRTEAINGVAGNKRIVEKIVLYDNRNYYKLDCDDGYICEDCLIDLELVKTEENVIEEAKKRYPVGTVVRSPVTSSLIETIKDTDVLRNDGRNVYIPAKITLYEATLNKWAEVVTPTPKSTLTSLPLKWCVKRRNRSDWEIIGKYNPFKEFWGNGTYYHSDANCAEHIKSNYTEITLEQFKSWVLGESKIEAYDLLAEARARYPKRTKFRSAANNSECYVTGANFKWWKNSSYEEGEAIHDDSPDSNGLVYCRGKWAEILPDLKITDLSSSMKAEPDLLKEARERYPIGSTVRSVIHNYLTGVVEKPTDFSIDSDGDVRFQDRITVYRKHKKEWGEIAEIPPTGPGKISWEETDWGKREPSNKIVGKYPLTFEDIDRTLLEEMVAYAKGYDPYVNTKVTIDAEVCTIKVQKGNSVRLKDTEKEVNLIVKNNQKPIKIYGNC